MTLPGIGLETASRIHEQLGIETMQELEAAANDGRLGRVTGMGNKRIRGIREALAGRFSRRPAASSKSPLSASAPEPSVAELLDIDREYREKVQSGRLRRIAPQRFNPKGEAWLPVLHSERGSHHFTALYSNTARAHELGTTRDWVIIYRDGRDGGGQWTAITAQGSSLRGRRIIRGREAECRAYYAQEPEAKVQKELPLAKPLQDSYLRQCLPARMRCRSGPEY
jgi:DNA polymerase (family X)